METTVFGTNIWLSSEEILQHCEDNAYVFSFTSRYWIWMVFSWRRDTPALWGQCLRILCGIWVFDLDIDFVIFNADDLVMTFSYCSDRNTLAISLFMTGSYQWGRAEHSALRTGLAHGYISLCEELVWRWNMRFQRFFSMRKSLYRGICMRHFVLE